MRRTYRLPGVCIACRAPVVWDGKRWLQAPVGRGTNRAHECRAGLDRKAHSVTVGVSDAPIDESARFPLTPVELGRLTPSVE